MHTNDLTAYLRTRTTPGSDLLIYRDHREEYRCISGEADENALYFIYSMSKVVTCTAAMRLVERGVIGIDDPVSEYLPAYKELTWQDKDGNVRPCKEVMTLRHLFAMRGGLSYNIGIPAIQETLTRTNGQAGTLELVSAFAKEPLLFEPGTDYTYSLCHDVLAAVVEAASGQRFGKYLQDNIFDPLGMADTGFRPSEAQKARFVQQYRFAEDGSYQKFPSTCVFTLSENYESGGAGLFSSTRDYMQVADALANHGLSVGGYRLLRPETVELMRSNQNDLDQLNARLGRIGYGYAFGVRTMLDREKQGSDAPTEFEFGWDGAAGAYVAIDPYHRVAMVYMQHVLGHNDSYGSIHPTIRDSAYYQLGIVK